VLRIETTTSFDAHPDEDDADMNKLSASEDAKWLEGLLGAELS